MHDESYPPAVRLRMKAEYERVLARRCSKRGRYLMVYGCENDSGCARLGRIVSKRWGNAVRRNLLRRWIREAFRKNRTNLPPVDLIVMILQNGIEYSQIENELPVLAHQVAEQLSKH